MKVVAREKMEVGSGGGETFLFSPHLSPSFSIFRFRSDSVHDGTLATKAMSPLKTP